MRRNTGNFGQYCIFAVLLAAASPTAAQHSAPIAMKTAAPPAGQAASPPAGQAALASRLHPALTAPRWQDRAQAFAQLAATIHYGLGTDGFPIEHTVVAPAARAALIDLLRTEAVARSAEDRRSSAGSLDYNAYLTALISEVAVLHDPAAIDALFQDDILRTAEDAVTGLAGFGDQVADRVLARFHQATDDDIKALMEGVMLAMLQQGSLHDPAHRAALRDVFLQLSESADYSWRVEGLRGLAWFHDDGVQARLREIAAHDPWQDDNPASKFYRSYKLRLQAEKLLHAK